MIYFSLCYISMKSVSDNNDVFVSFWVEISNFSEAIFVTNKLFNGLFSRDTRQGTQLTFTCSNSTLEILEKGMKYVQS